jgi:5-formyltetrahydrofolate cyclo-ligase
LLNWCLRIFISAEQVTKQAFRKKVWDHLGKNDLADFPRPVYGRIPNFKGSPKAAQKLSELDIFKCASTIMVTPDTPQETVRFLALEVSGVINENAVLQICMT